MSKKLKNKEIKNKEVKVKAKGKIRKSDLAYWLSLVSPVNPLIADVLFSKKGKKLILKGRTRSLKKADWPTKILEKVSNSATVSV